MSPEYAYNGPHERLSQLMEADAYRLMRAAFRQIIGDRQQFPTRGGNSPWSLMTCRLVGTNAIAKKKTATD